MLREDLPTHLEGTTSLCLDQLAVGVCLVTERAENNAPVYNLSAFALLLPPVQHLAASSSMSLASSEVLRFL